MNIYSRKQVWKLVLSAIALVIVAASLWYSSTLANNIAKEERKKVKLWAEAIQKRATLVKYTGELFDMISDEERKKVELWAEATRQLASADNKSDYTFVLKVVADNTTVPVILADDDHKVISHRNLVSEDAADSETLKQCMKTWGLANKPIEIIIYGNRKNYLYYKDSKIFSELKITMDDFIESFIAEVVINSASVPVIFTDHSGKHIIAFGNIDSTLVDDPTFVQETIASMGSQNEPIEVDLGEEQTSYIFYENSSILTKLKYFPIVQIGVISLFILIAYLLFSTARRSEQNQVWVGMAKETAHQLGTPLSSLMAWLELMKSREGDQTMIEELSKDVKRLETITDRFSKIGSTPKLEQENLIPVLQHAVGYVKDRSSNKIRYTIEPMDVGIFAKVNIPLFEWVVENICKNAIDAMNGSGDILIKVTDQVQVVYVDITDTGKGIPSSKQKTVFEPGYTTKARGWGLGLSLTKRIIENYHTGKIFVKRSEANKGTTFRIVLNK